MVKVFLAAAVVAGVVALAFTFQSAPATPEDAVAPGGAADRTGRGVGCTPTGSVADRVSRYDSVSVRTDDGVVTVCYSRPSARGRTMIGGQYHPFGELWRTGANEPTILHLSAPVEVAGTLLEPGSYSLYTIPGENEWEIFFSSSTTHWGNQISPEVRALEVGSARVPAQALDEHVETFTIRFEPPAEGRTHMVLEWERARVRIPLRFPAD